MSRFTVEKPGVQPTLLQQLHQRVILASMTRGRHLKQYLRNWQVLQSGRQLDVDTNYTNYTNALIEALFIIDRASPAIWKVSFK